MTISINGKDYEIYFGMGFVRALDEKYFITGNNGIKFGTGLETRIPFLLTKDPTVLAEFLYLGTCASEKRPTLKEVDGYLDEVEDIDALFEEVLEALKKQNATKNAVKQILETLAEQEKALKKTKRS